MNLLPNELYIHIYKLVFNDTVFTELKNKINGIQEQKIHIIQQYYYICNQKYRKEFTDKEIKYLISYNDYFDNLDKTLINKFTYKLINNTTNIYNLILNDCFFATQWRIPIKSFQNHHIYKGVNRIKFVYKKDDNEDVIIYEEIKGDCWQDIYETANKIIMDLEDYVEEATEYHINKIIKFKKIDSNTIRLFTKKCKFI